jgi:hypothetical protein
MVPIHECIGPIRDAQNTLNAHRHGWEDEREKAAHSYHPRRGGHCDSTKDRSPSPPLSGPQVFGRHILSVAFPPRYRPPMNIPNTPGKRTLNRGSRITGLFARMATLIVITSLSVTSPYSWPIRCEHGWSTFSPIGFKVRRI